VSGFSDPMHDMLTKIKDLRLRMQHLETDMFNFKSDMIPKCFQCGEQIAYHGQVYRCGDCSMPFHQRCLAPHFRNHPRVEI
jgi:hypothetical protein